jgi:hypothetical protein
MQEYELVDIRKKAKQNKKTAVAFVPNLLMLGFYIMES